MLRLVIFSIYSCRWLLLCKICFVFRVSVRIIFFNTSPVFKKWPYFPSIYTSDEIKAWRFSVFSFHISASRLSISTFSFHLSFLFLYHPPTFLAFCRDTVKGEGNSTLEQSIQRDQTAKGGCSPLSLSLSLFLFISLFPLCLFLSSFYLVCLNFACASRFHSSGYTPIQSE